MYRAPTAVFKVTHNQNLQVTYFPGASSQVGRFLSSELDLANTKTQMIVEFLHTFSINLISPFFAHIGLSPPNQINHHYIPLFKKGTGENPGNNRPESFKASGREPMGDNSLE